MQTSRQERLKYLRKKVLNFTQDELAEALDITQAAISNAENTSGNDFLKNDNLDKLVKKFNVNLHWLLNGEGEPIGITKIANHNFGDGEIIRSIVTTENGDEKISFIPDRCQAGFLQEYPQGNYTKYTTMFSVPGYNNGSAIAMKVEGDSMYPTLRSEDIVIVEPVSKVEYIRSNDIYIVVYHDDKPLIKRFILHKEDHVLEYYSDNMRHNNGPRSSRLLELSGVRFVFKYVMRISRASEMPDDTKKYIDTLMKQNESLIEQNAMLLRHQFGVSQNIS